MDVEKTDYRPTLKKLGVDMEAHAQLLSQSSMMYPEVILKQSNRPDSMAYFDKAFSEMHGARIKELQDHREDGGKVVGFFCLYMPEEIVAAAGGKSVVLCGGAEVGAAEVENMLPRNTCPLIKSFMGFKLTKTCPYFQCSDLVVGETTCDGKKKTYEILNEIIPTYVLEVPQMTLPEDRMLWLDKVKQFKGEVEKLTGRNVDGKELSKAIKLLNQKKRVFQRLAAVRRANPTPISGKDALLVLLGAINDNNHIRSIEKVSELCDELETRVERGEGVVDPKTPRIMYTGTPTANLKLHHLVETNGGSIVCDDACSGARFYRELVDENHNDMESQLQAISDKYLKADCAHFTPNDERIENIIRLAKEYNVNGVVYGLLQFCHTYAVEFYRVKKALEENNIPVILIETDYGQGDLGQISTRLQAFIEMISR